MTAPAAFESSAGSASLRARVVVAILASLVLLAAVGVIEVGALAATSVISSGTNHVGIQ
jgi:hypothetical protein